MKHFDTIKEAVENGTYQEPTGMQLAEAGARKIIDVGTRIRERAKRIAQNDREMQKLHALVNKKGEL